MPPTVCLCSLPSVSPSQGHLESEQDLASQQEREQLQEGEDEGEEEEDEPWAMADLDLRKTKSDPQLTVAGGSFESVFQSYLPASPNAREHLP